MPNITDLAAQLDSCRVFCRLDLRKGYLQVPDAAADIARTTIITPFSLFEFVPMPFGLQNAGITFQCLVDSLLSGLPFTFGYLDDILVTCSSVTWHCRHLALPSPSHGFLSPSTEGDR